ncbi:hypothetical protein KI372_09930 [Halobacterium salinarum]|nr:hypothetical protein [Halobacterium salinarum]
MPDGTSDGVESVTLEGPAAAWLAARAEELGHEEDAFLKRVVAAYRSVEDGELAADEGVGDRLTEVTSRVDELEAQLDDHEATVDELVEDVRERVVQVKRETDGKADAGHGHPELAADIEAALAAAEHAEGTVDAVAEDVTAVTERVDAGFENFEAVAESLDEETAGLSEKVSTLAQAVVSMREAVLSVGAAEARRARVDALKRAANVAGVRTADCEGCEQAVDVALLTAPECPFCGAAFADVSPDPGWFSNHTLETGETPALAAGGPQGNGEGEDSDQSWLGAETETLERMASAGDSRGDGDGPMEPSEVLDADAEDAGNDGGGA